MRIFLFLWVKFFPKMGNSRAQIGKEKEESFYYFRAIRAPGAKEEGVGNPQIENAMTLGSSSSGHPLKDSFLLPSSPGSALF